MTLKNYLISQRGEVCSKCLLGNEWNGEKLALQVDHIDGDSDNNFPDKLQAICTKRTI